MKMLWKIAVRSLLNNSRSFTILILNLSIGLSGLVALEIIKASFNNQMQSLSRSLLGGDIQVSSRRFLKDSELDIVADIIGDFESTHMIRTLSMARSKQKSRLVQIRGIEPNFPFYGEIKISKNQDLSEVDLKRGPPPSGKIWIYPEIRDQLMVTVGEEITLGTKKYVVDGYVIEEVAMGSGAATIAPRIYMSKKDLLQANLLQRGSTFADVYIYKLKNSASANELMKELNERLTDPAVNARSHQYSGQQTARLFLYLSDFLGLVALSAVALSLVAVTFLFRSYLRTRLKDIATLNSLGLPVAQSQWIYIFQIIVVGVFASLLSLVMGYAVLPMGYELVKELIPFEVEFNISWKTILTSLMIGTLAGFLSTYPFFKALTKIKANQLFQEVSRLNLKMDWSHYLYWIPAVIGFSTLSIWLANSLLIGGFFIIFFVVTLLALLITSLSAYPLLKFMQGSKQVSLRLSSRAILRSPIASLTVFISLSLATVLVLLVPFIENGLIKEFKTPENLTYPSFFLFDIQDEQLEPLKTTMRELGAPIDKASPLIRGRMISVNGESFKKVEITDKLSRDEQTRRRMINRGLNLSTRAELSDSEEIIQGAWFQREFNWETDTVAELSIEHRYAKRLGLKLHDTIGIEIQGVEFQGKITSVRRVRWISFQPNFFIQIQPGVVDDAPKTWVANMKPVDDNLRNKIQNTVVDRFPNISIVDVSRTVKTLLLLVDKLANAIRFMSLISFVVGLIVLGTLVREQVFQRRLDFNLLKVIGAKNSLVLKIAMIELMLVSFYATIIGFSIALGASFWLSHLIFDGIWQMPWNPIMRYIVPLLALTALICWMVSRRELLKSPSLVN